MKPETDTNENASRDSEISKEKTEEITEESTEDLEEVAVCVACHKEFETHYYLGIKNGFELVGCNSCGSVMVYPTPTQAELDEYHEENKTSSSIASIVRQKNKLVSKAKKIITDLTEHTKGKDFLDVNSNYGFAVSAATELSLNAKGIDTNETSIKYAKEVFRDKSFELTSIGDYAKQGNKADIVYCTDIIGSVADPDELVSSIKKILSPKGILYLETPDGNHFMLPGIFPKWKKVTPPNRIYYFSKNGIKEILERHDLSIKKTFFNLRPNIRMIITHKKTKKK